MPRTGYLIAVAVIVVLAAAGVFVWSNYYADGGKDAGQTLPVVPDEEAAPTQSREAQLVAMMNEVSAAGGFSATFSKQDLSKWILTENQKLERFAIGSSETVFARYTTNNPLDATSDHWLTQGLSVVLPLNFAIQSNGRAIEIGLVVRSAQSNGSPKLAVVYATQQYGNSGWKSVPLSAEFSLMKFSYSVPKYEPGYTNKPVVVIHSDPESATRSIEIIGIYVKITK